MKKIILPFLLLFALVGMVEAYTYDDMLRLKAAGAVTADGNGTVVNIGAGLVDADAVIDVSALTMNAADIVYEFIVQGSSTAAFSTYQPLTSITLGASDATGAATNSTIGRYVLPFRNEWAGTKYPYVRLYHDVTGAGGVSLNYGAFIGN